ncbi:hypothetical protein chiPu_0016349, partial [Chiloscyllium punctatum]|nr:hypothetical protein [Chiloscyllium punctatum]
KENRKEEAVNETVENCVSDTPAQVPVSGVTDSCELHTTPNRETQADKTY